MPVTAGAQVHGRLEGVPARLLKLRHDAQHHIGHVECNMGEQDRLEAQGDPEGDEHQHQGDPCHDIGV